MKNKLFAKLLQKNYLRTNSVTDDSYQKRYLGHFHNLTSGFTLIEVMVVIAMVGILSAIVAPSWLSFVAKQRLNKANDSVLAALQESQRQAKNTKRSYSVSFRTNNKQPQIAIHPSVVEPDKYWRELGEEAGVNTEKLLIGTNLDGINKTKNIVSYGSNYIKSKPQTISFNYLGILDTKEDGDSSDTSLKFLVAIPQTKTPTKPSDEKRCVVIETLIGGIVTAKNEDCDKYK
ncbi:prepilin-type N-terminal cleavage/methylation domain-containing protein [Rivularia sp. PCC 7116]|uniref:pilus assembly FimT family protein n=1 Tax=Rivularia sp. PCC 7116 TaxID=373994 RepID=UPI00029EC75E|nr:type II secretion system protein [Rivularia sp. PCC 7116]AFY54110.1 prepilin-type N-terminal cleavage/methylation domain-containing protein [Rivularia sp. PCC 7116]